MTLEADDRLCRTSSTTDAAGHGCDDHDFDDDHGLEAELIARLQSGQPVSDDLAAAAQLSCHDAVFEHCEPIVALPRSKVPDGVPLHRLHLLDDAIDRERLQALSEGAAPTARECRAWLTAYVERALNNDDADLTSSVNLVPIADDDGNTAYAIATVCGYSFSGVTVSWHGFALDKGEALAILRRSFYLSCDPLPAMPVVVSECGEVRTCAHRPPGRRRRAKGATSRLRRVK